MFGTAATIILFAAGASASGWKYPYYEPCKAIGLALDKSGSLNTNNQFGMMNTAVKKFVQDTSGRPGGAGDANKRDYYITYWDTAVFEPTSGFGPNDGGDQESYVGTVMNPSGGTNIGVALQNQLTTFNNNDVKKGAIILITDGQGSNPEQQCTAVKDAGYWLITIGVGSGIQAATLEACASEKDGNKLFYQINGMGQIGNLLEGPVFDLFKKQKCEHKKKYGYGYKKPYGYGYKKYGYKKPYGYGYRKPYYPWKKPYGSGSYWKDW